MPSIACQSRIRAVSDHCSLTLGIRHRLVAGNPSYSVYNLNKTRHPDDVDVLLASNLVITLSGVSDSTEVSAEEIYTSALSQHLVDYLQTNAAELGLNTVSKLHIDEEDGLLQLVLTSSRQISANLEISPVHVSLVAIDLCYTWETLDPLDPSQTKPDQASHPFSARLSLPYKTLLNNVVGRFVTWQLVKRYPLIFGPWCQQLDVECSYFPGIFGSIFRIMERSSNDAFRARCRRLIKISRRRRLTVLSNAAMSLSTYLASIEDDSLTPPEAIQQNVTDEGALYFALERVYRDGMSRTQFKGLAAATSADRADDEDLSHEHGLLSPEEPIVRSHEHLLWDDPFQDILTSTRSFNPSVNSWFLDMPSDGDNGFSVNEQRGYDNYVVSGDNPIVEDNWSDGELLFLERPRDHEGHYFEHRHGIDETLLGPNDTFCDIDRITPPPVLDFEDADMCLDPPFRSSQLGHLDVQELSTESDSCQFFPYDHITCEDDSTDSNSQDPAGQRLESEDRSQATRWLASLPSRSISGFLLNRKGTDLSGKQTTNTLYRPRRQDHLNNDNTNLYVREKCSQTLTPISNNPLDDDDLDLYIISDTDSNVSPHRETTFEKNCDLKHGGVSVAELGFPEESISHRPPTLDVTCTRQTDWHRQLRQFQDNLEDSDEELWRGEGFSAHFGEDVMDFGPDAS